MWHYYRGGDKSLTRPGRKQANVSVRMAWISFGALPCRKRNWMRARSPFCWNRARLWHASELVSFLFGLSTYQHPGTHLIIRSLNKNCLLKHVTERKVKGIILREDEEEDVSSYCMTLRKNVDTVTWKRKHYTSHIIKSLIYVSTTYIYWSI